MFGWSIFQVALFPKLLRHFTFNLVMVQSIKVISPHGTAS
jgi:hypothetical protein